MENIERLNREMLDITRERDLLKNELASVRYKNLLLNGRVGKLQEVEHECGQLKDAVETMRANREIELGCREVEASSNKLDNLQQRLNDAISEITTLRQSLSQAQMAARISHDKMSKTEMENEFLSVELGNAKAQREQTNHQLGCIQRELAREQAQQRNIAQQFELNQRELEVLRQRIRELEANQQAVGVSEHQANQMDYKSRLEDTQQRFASVAESLAVATSELAVERQAKRDIGGILDAERTRRAAVEKEFAKLRAQIESNRRRTEVTSEVADPPPPSI